MPNTLTQRIGPNSRKIFALETTKGSDSGATVGHIMPLRDESGFQIARDEVDAPYYNGTTQGWNSAAGPMNVAGAVPCGLEFISLGNYLKMPVGATGYNRVALVTGSLHGYAPPTGVCTPLSAQLQDEYLETTAQYARARYCMLRSLGIAYGSGGAAPLDLDFLSAGDTVDTDLACTKVDNGMTGVSVFNGSARLAVAATARSWFTVQPTAFSVNLNTGLELQPAAFNDGVAVAVNQGVPMLTGNIELAMAVGGSTPESDFTFRNYAKARTVLSYDCVWADQAVSQTPYPSAWLQLTVASMRVSRRDARPGGRGGKRTAGAFKHILDSTYSKIPAESFCTVVGPYAITGGSNDVFSVKPDGGATITVTLTAGAARTAAQIAAELNADVTFAAKLVADAYNGRVRLTTLQAGATGLSSSVQFITGVLHGCESTLGFNNTVITGYNAPYVWRLYNLQNSDY